MKNGEVSITLTRLERYIRKANDADDRIKNKQAEIHRLEDKLFDISRDLEDAQDMLDFCIGKVSELKAAAHAEGYTDEYLRQFMKDRKYKQHQTN